MNTTLEVELRGMSAMIRQMDDNSDRTMLTKSERYMLSSIIHKGVEHGDIIVMLQKVNMIAEKHMVKSSHLKSAFSKPKTDTSKPKTSTSKPKTATSKPKTTTSKPKTTTSKPKPTASKPKTTTSKPKTATSKPKTATSKPKSV